jgi:hypothetical protein
MLHERMRNAWITNQPMPTEFQNAPSLWLLFMPVLSLDTRRCFLLNNIKLGKGTHMNTVHAARQMRKTWSVWGSAFGLMAARARFDTQKNTAAFFVCPMMLNRRK